VKRIENGKEAFARHAEDAAAALCNQIVDQNAAAGTNEPSSTMFGRTARIAGLGQ
jgi:hypothetical protein